MTDANIPGAEVHSMLATGNTVNKSSNRNKDEENANKEAQNDDEDDDDDKLNLSHGEAGDENGTHTNENSFAIAMPHAMPEAIQESTAALQVLAANDTIDALVNAHLQSLTFQIEQQQHQEQQQQQHHQEPQVHHTSELQQLQPTGNFQLLLTL